MLIKAVTQAIPTYPMNVFRLPDRLCREIDAALAKFWWGNKNKDRSILWLNWEEMGLAKGDGGMSFRNLKDFNAMPNSVGFFSMNWIPYGLGC